MIELTITGKEGRQATYRHGAGNIRIGSDASCQIAIADKEASSLEAEISLDPQGYRVRHKGAGLSLVINGKRLPRGAEVILKRNDVIQMGSTRISVVSWDMDVEPVPDTQIEAAQVDRQDKIEPKSTYKEAASYRQLVHQKLFDYLDLKRMDVDKPDDPQMAERVQKYLKKVIEEIEGTLPDWVDREKLLKEVQDEVLGLGPLQDLIDDPDITEIMVNRKDQIYIEKKGKIIKTDRSFSDDYAVLHVIRRIIAPLRRHIDERSPMVDGRLKDGSRVNAVIPPVAIKGLSLTIRKFSKTPYTTDDLIRFGSLTPKMVEFLKLAVHYRQNIIISGGTGSGKTTLLNVIATFIPGGERIVTIEDAAELQLPQEHVVAMEARPPNIEGKGAIAIRDLVRNALRMRPDRIIVGECRGGEALDMLQAMNTGHDGSLTTAHANSPRDTLSRLETMVMMAGMDLPLKAIREQISSAVDLIVQQARFADGSRKVTHISEVQGMEGDKILLEDIFSFEHQGYDDSGGILGEMKPTGYIPKLIKDIEARKIKVPEGLFE